jgi:serine/threonine-protein kinase
VSESYEILSKLAEGGMAEIFLARATAASGPRRHVVLKRVSRERATDQQYVRMFLDEARLAAQLSHFNIAQVFDIGRLGASYFFTMEYVHGVTVQTLILRARERGMQLPVPAVLAIIAGAAAGLGHAHTRVGHDGRRLDIIHRDVSPSNLMVSFDGIVKVVDFGVAKAALAGRPETQAGEIKGKVAYLSPEQCRQMKLDCRSDLFSLGICAWEMLTRTRLFRRDTAFEAMAAIATEQAPPPSRVRPDLPAAVDALVERMLALEPAQRFQTADEVIRAVEVTAQQTLAPMAPATLARLLRDLFGVLPEPWLVLEGDVVTVMASPIPENLSTDDPEAVEPKLTSQFQSISIVTPRPAFDFDPDAPDDDLTHTTNIIILPSVNARETRIVPAMANEPVKRIGLDDTARDPQMRPSIQPPPRPRPATRPPDPPTARPPTRPPRQPSRPPPVDEPLVAGPVLPGMGPVPPTQTMTVAAAVTAIGSARPAAPIQSSPSQGSAAQAVTMLGSGPYVPPRRNRPVTDPSKGTGPRAQLPFVPPTARPVLRTTQSTSTGSLRWWILGGSLLGVVLTTIIVIATRDPDPPINFTIAEDAAVAPPREAVAVPPPLDASPDAAPAIDAAEADAVAEITPDAAEPDDVAELTTEPDKATPPTRFTRKLRTRTDMNLAYRARQFKQIVAACKEVGADDDRAVVCTFSACQIHNPVAQDWFRNISPKWRESTIVECKKHGWTIKDVCAADLLSCRK